MKEQTRSLACLSHEQVQNAKIESCTAVSSAGGSKGNPLLHDGLPQYCRPVAATGASMEGSLVVRSNRHGYAGFQLVRLGIGQASWR